MTRHLSWLTRRFSLPATLRAISLVAAFAAIFAAAASARAESAARCTNYANAAINDYDQMRKFARCAQKDSPRWQSNRANHYNWCLKAKSGWVTNESSIRDRALLACGARSKL
jgi:hypothetical protein